MAQSGSTVRDEFSSTTGSESTSTSDMAAGAERQMDRVVQGAQDTARSMAERGSDATGRVQEVAGNLGDAVQKSVKEQPAATLFIAAAMGFVLGALWKS